MDERIRERARAESLCAHIIDGISVVLKRDVISLMLAHAAAERDAATEHLLEVISAARDVIATLQKELGRVPGGYSTTMTENERIAAKAVADLDGIISNYAIRARMAQEKA